jgi:cytochrome c-type biogenesis protein CcmH
MSVARALALVLLAAVAIAPPAGARSHDQEVERRVAAIASELRCPVCQNLSVKDSPSDVAASFRARIRELVRAGKSDQEVKDFFVARYGEWILLSPPRRGIGLAVWLAPALALAAGLALAATAVVRWTRRARAGEAPLDDERLQRELADLDQQLAAGELEPGDHRLLRERLLARAAVPSPALARRSASAWRWPLAGLAAGAVIALTLAPALRERGANAFATGNDFGADQAASSWVVEWRAAEQAMDAGRTDEALERYRLAVAFAPDVAELRARFGFALASAGRSGQALEQLRRAVRDGPALPVARLYLGAVLFRTGRREAALAQWRRYLELEPRGEGARLVRRVLAGRGDGAR